MPGTIPLRAAVAFAREKSFRIERSFGQGGLGKQTKRIIEGKNQREKEIHNNGIVWKVKNNTQQRGEREG